MNNPKKLYKDMTPDEQLRWVQDFSDVMNKHGERVKQLTKDSRMAWTPDDHRTVTRLFALFAAWPFAEDFCEKAQKYGDYNRRAYRLPLYIEKVRDALADGLTMTDAHGRAVAVVLPGTPARRRGRPTNEEAAARLRGEVVMPTDDSPETRKRRAIAKLLGLNVINGDPIREKNNAELAAEREARKAEEAKRNPSLFETDAPVHVPSVAGDSIAAPATVPDASATGAAAPSPCAQLMSDSYEMRMAQDKLHLNQLAWLLSPELAKRTETVQSLRVTSESASERAKTMADMGASPKDVEPYAQQAKEATESYLAIYAAVDEELAILHKRLYLDLPFVEKFKTRFKGVDIEKVQYITRPYYEKVKSPELDLRIKTIIEQENPEYAAKMKAEEERKQEVGDLLRYLKRKDKPNVKQRIETMEKRYARLIELLGENEAKVYRPIVDAAIEDYEKNHKKPEKSVVSGSTADKKKAASKREKNDAGISSSEREQARRDNCKPTKKETKKTTTTKPAKK